MTALAVLRRAFRRRQARDAEYERSQRAGVDALIAIGRQQEEAKAEAARKSQPPPTLPLHVPDQIAQLQREGWSPSDVPAGNPPGRAA